MAQTYDQLLNYPCTQCGQPIPGQTLAKRQARNPEGYSTRCADCAAVPVATIRATGCMPWDGDFDWDLMTPVKDGMPYMPGKRSCGNSDCVNRKHVEAQASWQDLVAEQFSIAYRTNRRRNFDELLAAVKKERETANG